MKLSIGMMVKNEEKNLERCLRSLQPIMQSVSSELIIVDTGSTDNTLSIAKQFTDKIYTHPWENDFAKMRNFTVSYAQGDWFLFVDADEEFIQYDAVIEFLNTSQANHYNAACLKIESLLSVHAETAQSYSGLAMRLFRKTETFHFVGVIHERPQYQPPAVILDAVLLHHGYITNDAELRSKKYELYIPILKDALAKEPENIDYWYYLANAYSTFKNNQEALEPAIQAYSLLKQNNADRSKYMHVFVTLSLLYSSNGYWKETRQVAWEGLQTQEWVIDLWFYLATAQVMLEDKEDALQSYQNYLYYLENKELYAGRNLRITTSTDTQKEEVLFTLALLYLELERKQEAVETFQKIQSTQMIEKSLPPMIGALLAIQSLEDLYSFYQSVVALGSEEVLQKFYLELESGLIGLDVTHQEKIFRIFENEESEYGLLNKIRLWEDHKPFSLALLERLQKVRINELENYYGDLIYLLVKRSMTLQSFAHPIQEEKLESYIYYLTQKYEDISLTFYAYLKNNDPAVSLEDIRMRKILARLVLLIDSLDNEKYEWVFDRYVQDGVTYIRKIYRDEILQTENAYLLKNNEEEFLLYMRLAQSFSYSDQANYVRYLKYALLAYPYMNRGIERLLAQMETRQTDFQPAFGDELKAYSQIVKVNAKNLIEKGLLNEAAQIIREYEQIIADDPEIAEMKDYLAALANNRYA